MNEPEEGEYGWTTLMDEDARIEDLLTLWNEDVDTLVVFVRVHHLDLSSSNRFSSLTSSSTDMLVLCGAHGVHTPSVIHPTSYISSGLCSRLLPPRELQCSVLRVRLLCQLHKLKY